MIYLQFPQTDSQCDHPHRIGRDGRFQSGANGGERRRLVHLPAVTAGGGRSGGGWRDEGMRKGRQRGGLEGERTRGGKEERIRSFSALSYKSPSYTSQDRTPGTVSPTHHHGNADRTGQPHWHHHVIQSLEIRAPRLLTGYEPITRCLNAAVPLVTVGAVLGTVARDLSDPIGWKPDNRQLGLIGQDLSV